MLTFVNISVLVFFSIKRSKNSYCEIYMSKPVALDIPSLIIGGESINRVLDTKFLVFVLEDRLNFGSRVNYSRTKISK